MDDTDEYILTLQKELGLPPVVNPDASNYKCCDDPACIGNKEQGREMIRQKELSD
jgi:hypothetical protein